MSSHLFRRLFILLTASIMLAACSNDSGVNDGAGSGSGTSFNAMLLPTFESPRCQNCHGFDADNAVGLRHKELGRSEDCSTCHTTPGWKAPFKSFSFTGLSGNAICTAIKNKFGGDLSELKKSLVDSELAAWGIEDGSLPLGVANAPLAFPQNFGTFENMVNSWIEAGANCE